MALSMCVPVTMHVIRYSAALTWPKMAPTFLIDRTLNNLSALHGSVHNDAVVPSSDDSRTKGLCKVKKIPKIQK